MSDRLEYDFQVPKLGDLPPAVREPAVAALAGHLRRVIRDHDGLPVGGVMDVLSAEVRAPAADVHIAMGRVSVRYTADGRIVLVE